MQRTSWTVLAVLILGVAYVDVARPLAAQTADAKGGDSLALIEKRLERIEKMLGQHHHEMKATHHHKGVWHRIDSVSDKDPYIIILNSETGRVKFLDPKTANVYEK